MASHPWSWRLCTFRGGGSPDVAASDGRSFKSSSMTVQQEFLSPVAGECVRLCLWCFSLSWASIWVGVVLLHCTSCLFSMIHVYRLLSYHYFYLSQFILKVCSFYCSPPKCSVIVLHLCTFSESCGFYANANFLSILEHRKNIMMKLSQVCFFLDLYFLVDGVHIFYFYNVLSSAAINFVC